MTKDEIVSLVNEASRLERRTKTDKTRLDEIKAEFVKLTPGAYEGAFGAKVEVIQPQPGIRPAADAIANAIVAAGPDASKKLFARSVVTKPVKNFREVARAVLTPAKAEKVIVLCEVSANPYVLIS
jgi:hypothetical protein